MELIKVHVTNEQREILLVLVERRLNDLLEQRYRAGQMECEQEIGDLHNIKFELQQAGT